jgi:hypothetical protein
MQQNRVINTFPGEEFNRHEYNIVVESTDAGTKYSLVRSNEEHWAEGHRGQTVCAILDNGDGYRLSKHVTRDLGYDIAAELFILMSYINKTDNLSLFKGIIEMVDIVNIIEL